MNVYEMHGKFPVKNPERLEQWRIAIGQDYKPTSGQFICSKHFLPSDYTDHARLKKTAVPSVFHTLIKSCVPFEDVSPKCCVPYCDDHYQSDGSVLFFPFPEEREDIAKWARTIGLKDYQPTQYATICERHFTDDDLPKFITTNHDTGETFSEKHLIKGAVPSIYLHLRPPVIQEISTGEALNDDCNYTEVEEIIGKKNVIAQFGLGDHIDNDVVIVQSFDSSEAADDNTLAVHSLDSSESDDESIRMVTVHSLDPSDPLINSNDGNLEIVPTLEISTPVINDNDVLIVRTPEFSEQNEESGVFRKSNKKDDSESTVINQLNSFFNDTESSLKNKLKRKNSRLCFVCDQLASGRKTKLAELVAPYSKIPFAERIMEIVGDNFEVIINEQDVVCEKCVLLFNKMDKLENKVKMISNMFFYCMDNKYNLETNGCSTNIMNNNSSVENIIEKISKSSLEIPSKAKTKNSEKRKIFKCGMCDFHSENFNNVHRHQVTHLNKKNNRNNLKRKIEEDSKECSSVAPNIRRKYVCEICLASFRVRSKCLDHVSKDH